MPWLRRHIRPISQRLPRLCLCVQGRQCEMCRPFFVGDPKTGDPCIPCREFCFNHTDVCVSRDENEVRMMGSQQHTLKVRCNAWWGWGFRSNTIQRIHFFPLAPCGVQQHPTSMCCHGDVCVCVLTAAVPRAQQDGRRVVYVCCNGDVCVVMEMCVC